MMIVIHRILASIISVLTQQHELNMVGHYSTILERNSRQCFGLGTQTLRHIYDPQYTLLPTPVATDVVCCFRCVCLVVGVNLWPKTVVSHSEQNRYGWRRLTLLTARLIKFYGGLRLMKSTAAYGGLRRRLGVLYPKNLGSPWDSLDMSTLPFLQHF